jgi:hypothetical protein
MFAPKIETISPGEMALARPLAEFSTTVGLGVSPVASGVMFNMAGTVIWGVPVGVVEAKMFTVST